ncbi:conserved hypothetical protein [Alteromonas macleodii]|uniref:Transposase n=1 Tax=Alteromonas macleodii TaxID=28108 RepID=A0AB36G217_ALTMA|nr:hypothetical protein RJ43_08600 [Alteromonas macleodii]KHT59236.1 hypothetical protein RJ44_09555 [Alteromonas macleodii]OES33838.1 hypothetical protein BFV95_1199 [Alteromonas macleodii]OES34561.1 hypothetical protein BFV94_1199 [Alteromonas macleodii]OES42943.1 hypothetical protein BFV96_1198 [Alteromonas macleodii]
MAYWVKTEVAISIAQANFRRLPDFLALYLLRLCYDCINLCISEIHLHFIVFCKIGFSQLNSLSGTNELTNGFHLE